MTTIQTNCQECGKACGEISMYDIEFTGPTTCWECVFKACDICNGLGYTGWQDARTGEFDYEFCECNPLNLTIDEVRG
jgi:hypothetical protein